LSETNGKQVWEMRCVYADIVVLERRCLGNALVGERIILKSMLGKYVVES
jgi:hypothetical protein